MPQTFHAFCRLPRELRVMIWKLAIRSNSPGIHFFRYYDNTKEKRLDNDYAVAIPARSWDTYRVTVPKWVPRYIDANWNGRFGKGVIASWICNNPSTYLIDGALWTTCRESRLVMERQFDIQKWKAVQQGRQAAPGQQTEEWLHGEERMSSTGYFMSDDSTYRYFVVFPHQDLFCIQPYNFQTTAHSLVDYYFRIGSSYNGFKGFKNIAFEFDPAWEAVEQSPGLEEQDIIKYIYGALRFDHELETFWLIDYSIKRRHHVPTEKQAARPDGMVFYGSDCRFVEVARDDVKDYPWEGVLDDEEKYAKLGVLACEYF
ncbi:hypothetical protein M434DRAFT_16325 [Hypoxylon sp. CO27-5]|nr:hypothetical protein M434DRAFT_16325 [Hypoxylon sp. CO27-5]